MNFSGSDKVSDCIDQMQTAEIPRAVNRTLLNEFFNGLPLWSEEEAEENRILINFNDKSGAVLLHTARAQYENALMKQGSLFKVTIPDAPPQHQSDWSSFITRTINKPIMDSSSFYHVQDSVFGGVCLHGVGAKMWFDKTRWKPSFVGIQDILIPTDTELTMDNLQFFAVRRKMMPGELFKKTFAKNKQNIDPGWNLKLVRAILDEYKELNTNPQNYDWANSPEKMAELYKQNANYFDGDSAPAIWAWEFYHLEEDGENPGWYRKLILDSNNVPDTYTSEKEPNPFLYKSKKPVAMTLGEIAHFQFGDGNNVPPFMYHSIRSLAFLTYELLWTLNRLRCQWTQHVFEQMLTLFRVNDPSDRDRLNKVVMESPWGIIPEGLAFVPATERYAVDAQLVGSLQAEYKDLVGRATSSYTQQIDNGSSKERTKFEVQAMLQQMSALMSSLLSRAYRQETFSYREIARRFTLPDSEDFEVKKFRQKCLTDGKIPAKWLDISRWEIEIEQKLGGGNRSMEVAEASELMQRVNQFDPSAQAEIKHDYVQAITGNPKKAARIAPMGKKQSASDAIHDAELSFAALMGGTPVQPREGISHIEQVETCLKLMDATIKQITQAGGVGDQKQLVGLHLVAIFVSQHIAIIAQDPEEKQRVKQYNDFLGREMNQVKAFEQRQQEIAKKQQAQAGGGGAQQEAAGKIQAELIKAKAKAGISSQSAAQKRQQSAQKFKQEQIEKNLRLATEIQRDHAKALAETKIAAAKPPKVLAEK